MIVVLAGGVGGARFVDGVAQIAGAESVSAIVNTADDFDHYGLRICPDIDTVLYNLAGIADPVNGWGIAGDTRATLDGLAGYGEDPWFCSGTGISDAYPPHRMAGQWHPSDLCHLLPARSPRRRIPDSADERSTGCHTRFDSRR